MGGEHFPSSRGSRAPSSAVFVKCLQSWPLPWTVGSAPPAVLPVLSPSFAPDSRPVNLGFTPMRFCPVGPALRVPGRSVTRGRSSCQGFARPLALWGLDTSLWM